MCRRGDRKLLLLFVCVCALVGYGMFRHSPLPMLFPASDKVQHLVAFALVAILGREVFGGARPASVWAAFFIVALNLEWLQHQLAPAREFSLGDILANGAGVCLGMVVFPGWRRMKSGFPPCTLPSDDRLYPMFSPVFVRRLAVSAEAGSLSRRFQK